MAYQTHHSSRGKRKLLRATVLFISLFSTLLTADVPGIVQRAVPLDEGRWLALVHYQGLMEGFLESERWEARNTGLPKRVVYPFDDQGQKELTALATAGSRIAVSTNSSLYLSGDRGISFSKVSLEEPIRNSNYLTAVALRGESEILLGTSFNGFFRSVDGGASWKKLSESVPGFYRGAGFYEEVSAVAADPAGERVALGSSFIGTLYLGQSAEGPWEKIEFPYEDRILNLWFTEGSDLEIWGDKGIYRYDGSWSKRAHPFDVGREEVDPARTARLEEASGRYGIYVNPSNASGDKLDALLDFCLEHGMNSVTVDMKDDWGWITYDSALEAVAEVGSARPRFKLDELIAACHARGIYLIGRVVVFKDKRLYDYRNGELAIWDTRRQAPWGNLIPQKDEESGETSYVQREFWVDPFSEYVWKYNLALAKELEARGVDEIQFDYIRFPSDGDLTHARYRHRRDGMGRIDALESFLKMVRSEIEVPISTDLYGFNSWYRMGNWIGQNIDLVSRYVDAICPMYYPSHFPRQFMQDLPYLERAQRIYQEGSARSAAIARGRSIIRPYVQAFLLPFEYYMEEPEYSEYLTRQLTGTHSSPASGFTLWNQTNRYYMVTSSLSPFTSVSTEAVLNERERSSMLE